VFEQYGFEADLTQTVIVGVLSRAWLSSTAFQADLTHTAIVVCCHARV
jgi:hypothetical protein